MYNSQGGQVDLGQCLANHIQSEAEKGAVQYYIWQLASQSNYNNQFFVQLVNTLGSLLNYWAQTQPNQTLPQAINTVYLCACGVKTAANPQWQQQLSPADFNNMLSWAQFAQQIDAEITNFENQYRPQYAPVRPANPWDTAQYNPAPQFGAPPVWGAPVQPAPVNNWATRSPAPPVVPVQQPAARQPAPTNNPGGYQSRRARYSQQQPAPEIPEITPATGKSQPQFTQANPGWRNRSTQQPFNPDAPQHQPVGREVAEAHAAGVNASGSWTTSNFDWDDDITFGQPEPQPTKPAVQPTNTTTPQFMERFSSNKAVAGLVFDKTVDGVRQELTIEDWRTSPDPDFPWEMAYRPATHTRRIAYDVKRNCYVQQLEENKVKYDDHAVLETSAAVSQSLGSRSSRGATGRGFNGDSDRVTTLPGLIEQRSRIIDTRLDSAKLNWEKQEAAAEEERVAEGGNYVAPELEPTRDEAITTPLDGETDEQITLASGKLTADQLLTVELGNTGFANEHHAAFAMQAKLVVDGFDFSEVPVVSARYLELTPFVIANDQAEEVMEHLENLTDDTSITKMNELAKCVKSIAGKIPADIWNAIDAQTTEYVNGILSTELGLSGVRIDSFAEDGADLPEYLRTKKEPRYLENLSRRIDEFVRPLLCVVNTNLTQASFQETMGNLFPDMTPESDIKLFPSDPSENLVDRTVLVRRECTLSRTALTSAELGVYADGTTFVITPTSHPHLFDALTRVLAATARDDGKAGYFKRVLLTSDGVRFTIHENWMDGNASLILKR